MDDLTTWHRAQPRTMPKRAKYMVIHSRDVKVGDKVRVLEWADGAYREIEGDFRVVDG